MGGVVRCGRDDGRPRRGRYEAQGGFGKLAGLCHLLNEHGDAIEADLLRFYQIDLLDFYRGALSARRLGVLVKHLPRNSATARAVTDGEPPFSRLEHLTADLWALWARQDDHPVRAALQAKARAAARQARVIELKTKFEKHKRSYGLG